MIIIYIRNRMIMRKIINKYLVLAVAIIGAIGAKAQEGQEISIYGGPSFSGMNLDATKVFDVNSKNKIGGLVGIGYSFSLSSSLAIQTGVELSFYNSDIKINNIDGNYMTVDSENESVKFEYAMQGYRETVKATYVSLPLMLRYQFPLSKSLDGYAAAGTKIGFSAKGSYDSHLNKLNTSGTYLQWGEGTNNPIINDLPEFGFGEYMDKTANGDLSLKVLCTASAEFGVRYKINESYTLIGGLYFDYSLTNINKNSGSQFVQYNQQNPSEVIVGSVVESINKRNLESLHLTKKMNPYAFGLKIGIAYNL